MSLLKKCKHCDVELVIKKNINVNHAKMSILNNIKEKMLRNLKIGIKNIH